VLSAAVTAAPDLAAFVEGVKLGLFAAFLAISALLVLATVRRLLSV
jgi:hypothetical protein